MTSPQKSVFLAGEGNGYWLRNKEHLLKLHADTLQQPSRDPVIKSLLEIEPRNILEVGCANGWRLDIAHRLWRSRGVGIDPSAEAIADGVQRFPHIHLRVSTADRLPKEGFDCVIFGFCLYMCDRSDLFRIAAEADEALAPGGYLVVFDFFTSHAYQNPYSHHPGLFAYKMDYSRLWSWHPAYAPWSHATTAHEGRNPEDPDERLAVTILKKARASPGR